MTTLKQILCAIINFGQHKHKRIYSAERLWIEYAPKMLKILDHEFDEQKFYKNLLTKLNTCEFCGKIFESKAVR